MIVRTNSANSDFRTLVSSLDALLAELNGDKHDFYDQYNKVDAIDTILVCYVNGQAAGCVAMKPYSESAQEVKRMYVKPEFRKHGLGERMLIALEQWAKELGYRKLILETAIYLDAAHR